MQESSDLKNIMLILQYDGTNYSGWQVQNLKYRAQSTEHRTQTLEHSCKKNIVTIQGLLQEKIKKITGEDIKVIGASRTDAGVHALWQVASFKTGTRLGPSVLMRAINANLPDDVRVVDASECTIDFHPRFSAKGKTYSYIITKASSVFINKYAWHIPYFLSCDLMKEAAESLVGEHNFSSFQASGCSAKNPVRKIEELKIEELSSMDFMTFNINAPIIKISVSANAFLRHMVRNIVGTLVEAGKGKVSPARMAEVLELKDRRLSGPTAPACGLFLEKVIY
ncbi:MAG: tRNA pseudouridine(38-40) synthase TruA [Nitrospirae bacterium]|nr:tRNA pseudouridine(38-40) synthase TruA [Nitrospirota bacterium]